MGIRHRIATELSVQNVVPTILEGRRALQVVFEEVSKELQARDRVEVRGFGVFEVRTLNAKTMSLRGKTVHVPKRRRVNFRLADSLKKRLNPPGEGGAK